METFRARPGAANLALSLFAALGGLYILVYGSWKALTTESTLSFLMAIVGALVAARNIAQLIAWRAVLAVSQDGVELRRFLRKPLRAPLDACTGIRRSSYMMMDAVELTPARIRFLRVGYDLAAIKDAIERYQAGAPKE